MFLFYLTVSKSTTIMTDPPTSATSGQQTTSFNTEELGDGRSNLGNSGDGPNAGLIGGVTVGIIVLIIIVVLITIFLIRLNLCYMKKLWNFVFCIYHGFNQYITYKYENKW